MNHGTRFLRRQYTVELFCNTEMHNGTVELPVILASVCLHVRVLVRDDLSVFDECYCRSRVLPWIKRACIN